MSERRAESSPRRRCVSQTEAYRVQERDWCWSGCRSPASRRRLCSWSGTSRKCCARSAQTWAAVSRSSPRNQESLTPIRLSTRYLQEVWKRDRPHFRDRVRPLHREHPAPGAEELRTIATGGQLHSGGRSACRVTCETVREVVEGTIAQRRRWRRDRARQDRAGSLPARFDARLVRRACTNSRTRSGCRQAAAR